MVYLKKIELTHFKSFIESTEIPFSETFTIITGPNGSGKSNILDAVRWVLGEQRIKMLRAEKSDEVIFGGNKFYSPSNFAQVDLYIQVNGEEYCISRKIYREEESSYLLNGKIVRLKDLQLFLTGLGLGKYSFAFLGQNEIESLILREDGRVREIVESIAGISGYHEKSKEILVKLQTIESKWGELEEKKAELIKNIEVLRDEASTAIKYEELKNKLQDVQETLKFLSWQKLIRSIEKNKREKEDIEGKIREIKETFSGLTKVKEEIQNRLNNLETSINKEEEKVKEIENCIQRLNIEKEILRERKELFLKRHEEFTCEEEKLQKELLNLKKEKERLMADLSHISEESTDKLSEGIKEKEKSYREKLIEKSRLEERVRSFKEFSDIERLSLSELNGKMEKLSFFLDRWRKRSFELQKYQEKIEKEIIDNTRILHKKEEVFEKNSIEIRKLKNLLLELKGDVIESYPRGVREIVNKKRDRIYNIVKGILEIPSEYMEALYNLLGNSIYDIVVENERTAKELIDFLKSNNLGWATFRPLSLCRDERIREIPEKIKNVAIRALDVVKYSPEYEKLVKGLIGNVVIFHDFSFATQYKELLLEGWRIVTLNGEVFLPSGTISGGVRYNIQVTLSSEKAIIENEDKLKELMESNEFLEKDILELRTILESLRAKKTKLDALLVRLKGLLEKKEREKEEILRKISVIEVYQREGKTILERLALVEQEMKQESKELDELRERYEKLQIGHIGLEKDLINLEHKEKEIIERLKEIREEILALEKGNSLLEENIKSLELQLLEYEKKKEEIEAKNKDIIEENKNLKEELGRVNEKLQGLREEELILKERYKEVDKKITELEEERKDNFLNDKLELKFNLSEEKLKTLERELLEEMDKFGPINFIAKDKLKDEEDKYETLIMQLEDVKGSMEYLRKIIKETREEAERKFVETFIKFKDLADENWKLFFPNANLFLSLENENDPLSSDIVIKVSSQRKNWRNILMLSGGEKSLVGISILLAAVELAPVNFCFWDEVDAALDNQNAVILGQKIKKLSNKNQFIIISHNPILTQCSDIIYGVTLNEKGASQVFSWKLKEEVSN
ncbi:MAG TPA: chromosome segregation SMC family protein [Dictyoglomaceae bacterium]|nr:chromosome segregation SMC family protein [Dictyoglomaceae bacterium]